MSNLGHHATAAADSGIIQNIQLGIDNTLKIGCWAGMSFELTDLSSGEYQPLIRMSDPDGNPLIQRLPVIAISKQQASEGAVRTVQGVFRPGRLGSTIQVGVKNLLHPSPVHWISIRDSDTFRLSMVKQSTQVWLLIGDQPQFTAAAVRWNGLLEQGVYVLNASKSEDTRTSKIISVLPTDAEALDMVNVIVLSVKTALSLDESLALKKWVQRGGRLVMTMGAEVESLRTSPLSEWLPIQPTGVADVRNLGGINAAVPGSSPLRLLGSLKAAQLDQTQGRVLASGITGPLIMRAAYGLGQVTAVAVDLDQRPLSNWDKTSQTDFAAILANLSPPWENQALVQYTKDVASNLNPTGVSDLQTQLVNTLDDFSDVSRASHWSVLGWISLFMLFVGPLDYFLVRQVFKKPQLTWLTLPVWIGLASLFAVSQAQAVNQQPLQSRQVSLLDLDSSVQKIRGRTWYNFYSPLTSRNEISAAISSEVPTQALTADFIRTSWIERPESTFRGMYRDGDFDLSKPEYSYSADRHAILNLPTTVWSSGGISCEWEVGSDGLIESKLTAEGGNRISGKLTHQLPWELHNWFIAFGDFAYYPPVEADGYQKPLSPGTEVDIKKLGSNLLKGVLTGVKQSTIYRQRGKRSDPNVSRDQYDLHDTDPFALMRMVSFHEAAGGTEYTNLENQSNRELDVSQLLKLHRAVLFARIETPITEITIDGEIPPSRLNETYVRIILPVTKKLRDNDAAPDARFLEIIR